MNNEEYLLFFGFLPASVRVPCSSDDPRRAICRPSPPPRPSPPSPVSRSLARLAIVKTTKTCLTCGVEKPLIDFSKNYGCHLGVSTHCKECCKKKYREQVYGSTSTAKCSHCGNEFDAFNGKKYCSKLCKGRAQPARPRPKRTEEQLKKDAEYARQRRSTEEGAAAYRENNRRWKAINPDKVRDSRIKHCERKAEREGRAYRPMHERQRDVMPWVKARAARIAFRKFIDESSDEEVKCWYAAIGKPWMNPRIPESEKWAVRYNCDVEFHAKQKARLRAKKMRRKYGITVLSDNTASPHLLADAKSCLYCGAKFNDRCRPTLDHLIPLAKGGTHSAANLVVCCRSCNSRKGARDFLAFVQTLPDPHQARALRAWRQLRGAPPQQQTLIG